VLNVPMYLNVCKNAFVKVCKMCLKSIKCVVAMQSQIVQFVDTGHCPAGDITSRLTSDTTTMCSAIGLNLNIFLRSMIKAIGVCVFMFALSWRLAIVTFAGLPLVIIVSKVYGSYYKVWFGYAVFGSSPISIRFCPR